MKYISHFFRLAFGSSRIYACSLTVVASVLVLLISHVPAQEGTVASTGPRPAEVQIEASRVYVLADKTGLGHPHVVEANLLSSTLVLGAERNAGKLVFDMNSFDADTDAARKRLGLKGTTDESTRKAVNENMRSSAVLDVVKYPTAIFDITSAKPTGELSQSGQPTFRLEGKFTLHGTTQPVSILVQVEQARGWLHIRGRFAILQSSFGIKPYTKALGAIGVADQLQIFGDLYVVPTEHVVLADIPAKP